MSLDPRLTELLSRAPPPLPKEDLRLALRLTAVWGDSVLCTAEIEGDRTIAAGSDRRRADLVVEHEILGAALPIATTEGELARFVVPSGARAAVRRKDGAIAAAAPEITLAPGDRIAIGLGAITMIGEHVGRARVHLLRNAIDFVFLRIAALSMIVHLFLIVLALLSPRTSLLFDGLQRGRGPFILTGLKEPEKEKKKIELGRRAPKPEGKAGPRLADAKHAGPRALDPKQRKRDWEVAQSAGLLGALRARGPGLSGVFGHGDSSALNDALDGLHGDGGLADGGGNGGLGSRGNGPGGGGDGPVGIGPLGDPHGRRGGIRISDLHHRATVHPCTSGCRTVLENIDRREVARVMERNRARFKYCYERELQADPNLGGKVSLDFIIGPDGSVAEASIFESTMGNAVVERCLVTTTRTLKFPAVKGGGIAHVRYPFLFTTNN